MMPFNGMPVIECSYLPVAKMVDIFDIITRKAESVWNGQMTDLIVLGDKIIVSSKVYKELKNKDDNINKQRIK